MRWIVGKGIGIPFRMGSSQNWSSYWTQQGTPELIAYTDGLSTDLSNEQKLRLSLFLKRIKTKFPALFPNNLWSDTFDFFYLLSGETIESSYRNLAQNAYHLTGGVDPAFVKYSGFQFNGVNMYKNTKFNPATAGGNYKQNDASIGVISRTATPTSGRYLIGNYDWLVGANMAGLANKTLVSSDTGLNNQPLGVVPGRIITDRPHALFRTVAAGYYHTNGLDVQYRAGASKVLYSQNMYLGCINRDGSAYGFCDDLIALAFAGKNVWWNFVKYLGQCWHDYMVDCGSMTSIINVNQLLNGTFDDTSAWTYVYGDWDMADGVAHRLATSRVIRQPYYEYEAGATYRIEFDISNCATVATLGFIGNGGWPWVEFPSTSPTKQYANGHHVVDVTCSSYDADGWFEIDTAGGVTFDLDNVSIVKLTGLR